MNKKRIDVFAFSDSRGGAAIAASRQVSIIESDYDVRFFVAEKIGQSNSIGPKKPEFLLHFFLRVIGLFFTKLLCKETLGKNSLNLFSSTHIIRELIKSDAEVCHFHWINNDTVSLRNLYRFLSRSECKVVITMHDEWLISNYEHCLSMGDFSYKRDSRAGFVNKILFERKKILKKVLGKSNVIVTVPSSYLKLKAKESYLLSDAKVSVIGNVIDTSIFRQLDRMSVRKKHGLPNNSYIIACGAVGGQSHLKGADLLHSALDLIDFSRFKAPIVLLSFGAPSPKVTENSRFLHVELGRIDDIQHLVEIYNCADVTVVPSRVESFGQVAAESLSCGVPVIGFDNTGLKDIVLHGKAGFLAPAYDVSSLAQFILDFSLLSSQSRQKMGESGRQHILDKFSKQVIASKWQELYSIQR